MEVQGTSDIRKGLNKIHSTLDSVASLVTNKLNSGQTLSIEKKNIGFTARNMKMKDDITVIAKINSQGMVECQINDSSMLSTEVSNAEASIHFPKKNFDNFSDIVIYSFSYRTSTFFETATVQVGSSILSATINNIQLKQVLVPISLQFKSLAGSLHLNQRQCKYWNENSSRCILYF